MLYFYFNLLIKDKKIFYIKLAAILNIKQLHKNK